MITVYGDLRSGNCLKVKWILDHRGLNYRWVPVDVMTGGSRTADFLAVNPAGQVPVVVLADGRPLAQSNAIVLHFAEETSLLPSDAYERSRVLQWLFWEQYSHEPYLAVQRFQVVYQGRSPAELDPKLGERGRQALALMEGELRRRDFLVGSAPTAADLCLLPYTLLAPEGGFDLAAFPAVEAWTRRACDAFRIHGAD